MRHFETPISGNQTFSFQKINKPLLNMFMQKSGFPEHNFVDYGQNVKKLIHQQMQILVIF